MSRNVRLPYQTCLKKQFNCRLGREMLRIPIMLMPRLGVTGEDYLDPVKIEIDTNLIRDIIVATTGEGEYRIEKVDLELSCKFDQNRVLSFKGKIRTPGFFGYEKEIVISPGEIAQRVRQGR